MMFLHKPFNGQPFNKALAGSNREIRGNGLHPSLHLRRVC